jgi:hypothetical protein
MSLALDTLKLLDTENIPWPLQNQTSNDIEAFEM